MQLRYSAVKFLNFFKSNPCLAAISEFRTGKLLDINEAYVEATGYTLDEAVGKTTFELGLWIDSNVRNQMIAMIDSGQKCSNIETQLRIKSGEIITILLSGEKFVMGESEYFFTLAVDITRYKQMEKILKKTTIMLESTIKSSPLAIIVIDNEDKVSIWNQAAEKLFGWHEHEVIGQTLPIIPDEKREEFEANRKPTNRQQIITLDRTYRKRKDGSLVDVSLSVAPMIDADGNIIGRMGVFADITEHIQAEKKLRESEEKYRFLAEKMTDIVWIQDINLRTIYVSPSIEAMLGFTPEERMAQNVSEQLTPASLSVVLDTLARELALEQEGKADPERTINIEVEYYKKNGSTVWFENIVSGIRDDKGILIGAHGVSRDITNRKKAEDGLRESEKKYRDLVDFLPIPLYEMDKKGNIISGNHALFEIFGYTPDDLKKGLNIKQIFSSEDIKRIKVDVKPLLKGEKTRGPEYTGIRKDGSKFPLIVFSSPIIRDGKSVGLRGAIIDITERKQAEESLQKANLSLANAQRIAHIGNWELNVETNEMYCSDEVYRILGIYPYPVSKTIETCLESIHPEDREKIKESFNKAINQGARTDNELRIVRSDGLVREVRLRMEPVYNGSDKPVSVVGIIRDITEKNQADRELQNARDLLLQSEKLAAVGRLAAGVAHEVLNPLNIISMELQILQAMNNLSPVVKKELKVCMQQIPRIVGITDNLKQFSRIPEKKMILVNINDVVAHVLDLYATQMKIEGVETEVHYQPDLPETVVDKAMMEEVILNLISNAMAAMERKGKKVLRITTEKEIVKGNYDQVKIMIADTGTGINSEHMSKIFEPFFTTKELGKGTGLGLSISYGIVHDHGGKIWVENNEGGGATFYISLPVKENINNDCEKKDG